MSKGEVLATGSPAKLKEEYGTGYRVNVKTNSETSLEDVQLYINTNMAGAKLLEHRQNWIKYIVQGKISILLGLLTAAKAQKIIDGFTIDVSSLEDIFLEITNNAANSAAVDSDFEPVISSKPSSEENDGKADIIDGEDDNVEVYSDGDSTLPCDDCSEESSAVGQDATSVTEGECDIDVGAHEMGPKHITSC